MIPSECRECWNPECILIGDSGGEVDWSQYGDVGCHCPCFVPTVNALRPCGCCGMDLAMLDILDSGGLFVWCQHCGTTTNTFETAEEAVMAWNRGEVSSQ